jgi:hypothetical protein
MDKEATLQKLIQSIYEYKYLDNYYSPLLTPSERLLKRLKRKFIAYQKKREIKKIASHYISLCILNNESTIEIPLPIDMSNLIDEINQAVNTITKNYSNNVLKLNSTQYRLLDNYQNKFKVETKLNLTQYKLSEDCKNPFGVVLNLTINDFNTIYKQEYMKLYEFEPFKNNADPYTTTARIIYNADILKNCIAEAKNAGYKLININKNRRFLYSKFTCIFEKI